MFWAARAVHWEVQACTIITALAWFGRQDWGLINMQLKRFMKSAAS